EKVGKCAVAMHYGCGSGDPAPAHGRGGVLHWPFRRRRCVLPASRTGVPNAAFPRRRRPAAGRPAFWCPLHHCKDVPMRLRNLLAAGLLAATTPALAADTYVIDPTHAQVEFTYSHFGFSNITGRFDRIEGSIVHDAEDPANSSVQASIAIDSVSTGVADLDEHLRGSDFFDAGSHPVATFHITAAKAVGEGRLEVTGDL